ncbi:NfeD family protein [Aestuariivirga sp.]|uniref:NfeD family protein n=1 Tax=Aestuariivirga sp. TaxID=2650926 RepID=UPI0025BCE0F3|nr:NfeD family protein [Aestuariivirga sp.]MCA3556599.1 NfeD family protein [Aestuariivirga sp.]
MEQVFPLLGNWVWFVAAGILLLLELLSPGVFFIWLGIAAALTGVTDNVLDMPWQGELLVFAMLSAMAVIGGRRFYKGPAMEPKDNPHLNRRQFGYVGRSFTLGQPIINGRGKLTIEDTVWQIEGPDMEAGTRVKVTAVNDMTLVVAAN